MSDGMRFDFINYSSTLATVTVTTNEDFKYEELLASTSVALPGGNLQSKKAGSNALKVEAGRCFGFASDNPASITDVSGKVTILVAGGKDPWPLPPPAAPSSLAGATDWAARFKNFNAASAADAAKPSASGNGHTAQEAWPANDDAPHSTPAAERP